MAVVWHRGDLRVHDNPALNEAVENHEEVNPVFVVDPNFYGEDSNCDARIEFVFSCTEELDPEYRSLGSSLSILHGKSIKRLKELDEEVYFNVDVHAGYARERDLKAKEEGFIAVRDDGIQRQKPTRDGWGEKVEEWFESAPHTVPDSIPENSVENDITIEEARDIYDVKPRKPVPEAGETAAKEGPEEFLEGIETYPQSISPPLAAEGEETGLIGTSKLSPYFSVGALSLRTAYTRAKEVQKRKATESEVEMFTERLFWNRHFTQKLQDNPELPYRAVNPVFRGMNRNSHDPDLVEAWKNGETGYPLVDASMRSLSDKGWLNFRSRAMVASFFTYILKQPWWIGARHMRRELIDGDTAINYAQWQMQSGLVGVHPNRIYNPTKQVEENDPEGGYVQKYVPELSDVPSEYIAEPWKMPDEVQQGVGVILGKDYPEPVVDFDKEADRARKAYSNLADRAREALSDPEVYERASLPERRSREELNSTSYSESDSDESEQTNLGRFR